MVSEGIDYYKAICAATTHSLKREFQHISDSVDRLRQLSAGESQLLQHCDLIEMSIEYSQLTLLRLLDHLDLFLNRVYTVNIAEILKKAEALIRPRIPSSIQFQVSTEIEDQPTESFACTDPNQLLGILVELAENAKRELKDRGGRLDITLGRRNSKIQISVRDNGSGIPPELKERVLKEQVGTESGSGLGLFLSNKVIRALGGEMNIASSIKGTTVTIILPAPP